MKKLLFFLFFAASLVLLSCDNFMNGSAVQDQLEEMIDKATAKSYTIVISNDTTMGSFLSSGDKSCQVGYSIDVQFNVKKDLYIYKGLKAVSKSDDTKSLANFVQFTEIDSDDARGVYKTSIKLLQASDDILIIPDCDLVPNVLKDECKPENIGEGVEQDSTIAIVFNKPVVLSEFFAPVITDASGQSLTDYFETPYLSADSKTLYIPTDKTRNLLDPDGDIPNKDIVVKIDLTEIKDEDGHAGNSTFQFKYRVNKERDNVRPVIKEANLYTASNKTKELTNKVYPTAWVSTGDNNGDYGTNHINASVYAEIDGYDNESGIAKVVVKETLVANSAGDELNTVTGEYPVAIKKNEDTGKYYCDYVLSTSNDGIIKLDFFVEDFADNRSEASKTFYVIKDTVIEAGSIKFKNEFGTFNNTVDGWLQAIKNLENQVQGNTQKVKLEFYQTLKDTFFDELSSDYNIEVFWGYDEESYSPLTRSADGTYSFTRDINRFVYIKLIVQDAVGNSKTIVKYMPPKPACAKQIMYMPEDFILSIAGYDSYVAMAHQSSSEREKYQKNIKFLLEYTPRGSTSSIKRIIDATGNIDNENVYTSLIAQFNTSEDYSDPTQNSLGIGTYVLHAIASFGDFPSFLSDNFFEVRIDEYKVISHTWDMDLEQHVYIDESTGQGFRNDQTKEPSQYEDYICTLSIDDNYNHNLNIFGESLVLKDSNSNSNATPPTIEYEYGPINDKIKITKTPLKNSGVYKVQIDNYKKLGVNTDNIVYKFYYTQARRDIDPSDLESESYFYKVNQEVESAISEMMIPGQAGEEQYIFLIRIQAYDPNTNKLYMPVLPPLLDFTTESGGLLAGMDNYFVPLLGKTYDELKTLTDQQLCALFKEKNVTESHIKQIIAGIDSLQIANPRTFKDLNGDPIIEDCTADLEPPELDISDDPFALFGSYKINAPRDYKLLLDDDNFTSLTYYYIPCSSNDINLIPSYSLEELKTVYFRYAQNIKYSEMTWKVTLPPGNIKEGLYTLSIVAEDSKGNTMVKTVPFINTILGKMDFNVYQFKQQQPTSDQYNNKDYYYTNISFSELTHMITENSQQVTALRIVPEVFDSYNGWGSLNSYYNYYNDYPDFFEYQNNNFGENVGIVLRTNFPARNLDKNYSWIRVKSYVGFSDNDSSMDGKGFYYPEYFYIGPGLGSRYNPLNNNHDCMEGITGIQVFDNYPVLAHTMYSMDKLTETTEVENARGIWESKGVETGLAFIDMHPSSNNLEEEPLLGAGTYKYSNYDSIPEDAYYTTIFHFADGGSVMTNIKQK